MYQDVWNKLYRSVCSVTLYGNSGGRILGVTGFRIGEYIITDSWVNQLDDVSEVKICFYQNDGFTISRELIYTKSEFSDLISQNPVQDKYGLTILKCGNKILNGIPEVEICQSCNSSIGKDSFIISHQYMQRNIGINQTLINSYTKNSNGLNFILYDGSVKQGSSGAPLFDKVSGKLIGVIANKELSIVHTYSELLKKADSNLEKLEKVIGKMVIDDIDIIQVMMACQNQLKHISREFFANFAAKIGYALESGHITELLEANDELDFED